MSGPLLYSTNTLLKFIIQQRFRGDIHWVWCSEVLDSKRVSIVLRRIISGSKLKSR